MGDAEYRKDSGWALQSLHPPPDFLWPPGSARQEATIFITYHLLFMIIKKKWNWYNDIDPYVCEWARNLIKAGHIADGDVDERSILEVKSDAQNN